MRNEQIARSHRPEYHSADPASGEQVASGLPSRISQQHSKSQCPEEQGLQFRNGRLLLHSIRDHQIGWCPVHPRETTSFDAFHAAIEGSIRPCIETRGRKTGPRVLYV